MKVSRNLTASLIALMVSGGIVAVGGLNPLHVPMLTAAETPEEPYVINSPERQTVEPQALPSDTVELPAGKAGDGDVPYGVGDGTDLSRPPGQPDVAVQESVKPADDVPFGVTDSAAPAPVPATSVDAPAVVEDKPVAAPKVVKGVEQPEVPIADMPAKGGVDGGMKGAVEAKPAESVAPTVAQDRVVPPVVAAEPGSVAPRMEGGPKTSGEKGPSVAAGKDETGGAESVAKAAAPVVREVKVPQSQNDPGKSIITCVAGCAEQNGKPVYQGGLRSTGIGPQVSNAAAASGGVPGVGATIDCVAGCYSTPKSYQAPPAPVVPQVIVPVKKDDRKA